MGNCLSSHDDNASEDQDYRPRSQSMTVVGSPPLKSVANGGLPDDLYKMVLRVAVHEGMGLVAKDSDLAGGPGSSDPYVKLRMSSKGESFCTTYRANTLHPKWEETVVVDVDLTENGQIKHDLVVTVMDSDLLSFDDTMGVVRIPCQQLDSGEPKTKWFKLKNGKGKIRLTLEMKRILIEDDSVAGYLEDKMLDAVEIILKAMKTWGVEANLSVSFSLGIFKFSVSCTIDGLQTTVEKVEDSSEKKENAGEQTDAIKVVVDEPKNSLIFEQIIVDGIDKLRLSVAKTRAAFKARGMKCSASVAVNLTFFGIGMRISVTVMGRRSGVAIEEHEEHLHGLRMVEEQAGKAGDEQTTS
eukprot:175905_1